jgi:hypothetical protein
MRKPHLDTSILLVACLAILTGPSLLLAEKINPQKAKPSENGEILWYDGMDLLVEGKGWTDAPSFYARLPAKAQGKATPGVWGLSSHSAGLCLRFATDAPTIQVRWTLTSTSLAMPHMPATGVSGVDLYTLNKAGRWQFVGNAAPNGESATASFTPPPGEQYRLYLPLYNGTRSVEIGIPKDRSISKSEKSASEQPKPIVWYGTSIVQGGCASRPGMAATAIVGRQLDAEVINLGFSGSGRMEPEMADLLAELDPSVYVLDCLWNMSPELVSQRVEPFVEKLRAAHPNTPILLAEDSSFLNVCPTGKGGVLRTVLDKLTAEGVKDLHFLSSENMLGTDGEGTVDACHPNDLGMMRQAEAFTKALQPLLPNRLSAR